MAFDSNRGRSVLFGGDTASDSTIGDTWEWNGEFWTQTQDMGPVPRRDHALCFDDARKTAVLFGGTSGQESFADTWIWDGEVWTQVEDTGPSPRVGHAIAFDSARARAVLFGGEADELLNDTWEWDGQKWTQAEDVGPSPRKFFAMAYDISRKKVVLFGGDPGTSQGLGDTWEWDGTTWSQLSDFGATPCLRAAMVSTESELALFGGISSLNPESHPRISRDTWTFDGKHWTHRQDIGPGMRWSHSLTYDSGRHQIVLFGGLQALVPQGGGVPNHPFGDTWEHPVNIGASAAPTPAPVPSSPLAALILNPTVASPGQPVAATVTLNQPTNATTPVTVAYIPQSIFQAALQNPGQDVTGAIKLLTQLMIPAGLASGQTQFAAPQASEPIVVFATTGSSVDVTAVLRIS